MILFTLFFAVSFLNAQAPSETKTAPLHVPAGVPWLNVRFEKKCADMVESGEKIDVIMLGDSITHLWTWDKPDDPVNEPYRGDAIWARYFDEPGVFNFAFDGGTTQTTLARLDAAPLSAIDPKVAVVLIGTNNVSGGETPEQIVKGIETIENKLRSAFPGIHILQLALFPRGESPDDPKRRIVNETNRILRNQVADASDVTFLDLGPQFLRPDGTIPADIMPDFLHVNPKGFEIWGKEMKPILDRLRADVVIYGGTGAAVTAAIQTKRMGKSVVLVSPDRHLGGLTSGGLGFTDSGKTAAIGGLAREFYRRVYAEYEKPASWRWERSEDYVNTGQGTRARLEEDKTMWVFEPHIAEQVFDQWVKEAGVPVFRGERLDRERGVQKVATKIDSFRTLSGKTFPGEIFIDATYEGDLMAAAGVTYQVGRESNALYGERWNGNQVGLLHHRHWFVPIKEEGKTVAHSVSPWNDPTDPASGRVSFVDDSLPGVKGEGDSRIQAYCFRVCMTRNPENRVPFRKPENYDPARYRLMTRVYETGWRELFEKYDAIPNLKTDTNNHGPFSSDFIGMNYDYPDADDARREEIIQEHRDYQEGLLYFQANDPSVPEEIRRPMSEWGLAKDEFLDNGHWPRQIYVREARRMVGEYVMTEWDILDQPADASMPPSVAEMKKRGSVGLGSYGLDLHNARRYVTPEGTVQNEGDVGVPSKGAYPIDFGAILPKKGECDNLLVPVCVSASHSAYGSIRMEPIFMILGQSAATAGVLALESGLDVGDVPYSKLSQRLADDAQRLAPLPETTASNQK